MHSPLYDADRAATREIWARTPLVLETAGTFVLLTYVSVPVMTAVGSVDGLPPRSKLDGAEERVFLQRLLDLGPGDPWTGGVRNPLVRAEADGLYRRHLGYAGMRNEFLQVLTALLALAPLRVHDAWGTAPDQRTRSGYWRYMRCAMGLLGGEIGAESVAEDRCRTFVEEHAGRSGNGKHLLRSVSEHHPDHVDRARELLYPASRAALT